MPHGNLRTAAVTAHEASTAEPGARTVPGRLRRLGHVTLPGSWGALVVACLSFTPSLLPRGGLIQGLVWGITAAIGYGLGVVAAWIWRAFADRDPRPPRSWAWPTFLVSAAVLLRGLVRAGPVLAVRDPAPHGGVGLQHRPGRGLSLVAAAVFCLLILTGRGLRRAYRSAARLLRRWVGPRAAAAVGWGLVVGLT